MAPSFQKFPYSVSRAECRPDSRFTIFLRLRLDLDLIINIVAGFISKQNADRPWFLYVKPTVTISDGHRTIREVSAANFH